MLRDGRRARVDHDALGALVAVRDGPRRTTNGRLDRLADLVIRQTPNVLLRLLVQGLVVRQRRKLDQRGLDALAADDLRGRVERAVVRLIDEARDSLVELDVVVLDVHVRQPPRKGALLPLPLLELHADDSGRLDRGDDVSPQRHSDHTPAVK